MTKNMDSDTVKIIRAEIGEPAMTKKQRKKEAKDVKRYQKERDKRIQADRDLGHLLTQNKIHANKSMKLEDLVSRSKK